MTHLTENSNVEQNTGLDRHKHGYPSCGHYAISSCMGTPCRVCRSTSEGLMFHFDHRVFDDVAANIKHVAVLSDEDFEKEYHKKAYQSNVSMERLRAYRDQIKNEYWARGLDTK